MKSPSRRQDPGPLIGAGFVSLAFLFLAFLAYHDIGVGEPDLRNEYGILVVAGAWFVLVVAWLLRKGQPSLAAASLIALVALAWATWKTAAAPAPFAIQGYPAASIGYVWLIILAALLMRAGFRLARQGRLNPASSQRE